MAKIRILNRAGQAFEAKDGRTLLGGALAAQVRWRYYCGGKALCGTCAMLVVDGEVAPPDKLEQYFIEGWGYHPRYRLACQAKVRGDCAVINCSDAGFEKEAVLRVYEQAKANQEPGGEQQMKVDAP